MSLQHDVGRLQRVVCVIAAEADYQEVRLEGARVVIEGRATMPRSVSGNAEVEHFDGSRRAGQPVLDQLRIGVSVMDSPAERAGVAQCDDAGRARSSRRELLRAKTLPIRLETKGDALPNLDGVERVHRSDAHVRLELVPDVAGLFEVTQPLDVHRAHAARSVDAVALAVHPVIVGEEPDRNGDLEVVVAGQIRLYAAETDGRLGHEQKHDRRDHRKDDPGSECGWIGVTVHLAESASRSQAEAVSELSAGPSRS